MFKARSGLARSVFLATLCVAATAPLPGSAQVVTEAPITIGRSYGLTSQFYPGRREVNVWTPPGYERGEQRYPVLILLDGGRAQDFHHISGLAQLGTISGSTRDVIVVGVASVDRRNELALPTEDPELIRTYPTQGDSARFRRFLEEEVLPFVESNYRTSGEAMLMGESLAGLFVVETFLNQPDLFDHYVAVSPSLWWDQGRLAREAESQLREPGAHDLTLWLSTADEGGASQEAVDALVSNLRNFASPKVQWSYQSRPDETHATTFHGAALDAYRAVFASPPHP